MERPALLATALLALLALPGCQGAHPRPTSTTAHPPLIVAHRGGTADAPENTLEAIRLALSHHVDAIWLTVQLSADGVPVLYRPADLNALTDGTGPVAQASAARLAALNAGWQYRDNQGAYPYRTHPVGIPTLREALRAIPPDIPVILDMKALPAGPQAEAVARVLTEETAWSRVTLYSTDASYQAAFSTYPHARMFEARDVTRQRLLDVLLADHCDRSPDPQSPAAFEWQRDVTVSEAFTLGEAHSKVAGRFWTPATTSCFHAQRQSVLAIGVNNTDDYRAAWCLGLEMVLVDSPAALETARATLAGTGPRCTDASSTR